MMEAVCTSETLVDNHFTRQYNPEDSSEHHTRRRENLKSNITGDLSLESLMDLTKSAIMSVTKEDWAGYSKYVHMLEQQQWGRRWTIT
jgi:hypothetical protein